MAAMAMASYDLEGHSPVADLIKCNLSNVCAAFYTISTDSVLVRFSAVTKLLVHHKLCNSALLPAY